MPLICRPSEVHNKITDGRPRAIAILGQLMNSMKRLRDTSHMSMALVSILRSRGMHGEALEQAFEEADYSADRLFCRLLDSIIAEQLELLHPSEKNLNSVAEEVASGQHDRDDEDDDPEVPAPVAGILETLQQAFPNAQIVPIGIPRDGGAEA